jgi:thymidylate synthase (FAD)
MAQRLKLMAHTPKPRQLLYLAARQCYYPGWVGDFIIEEEGGLLAPDKDSAGGYVEVNASKQYKIIRDCIKSGHHSILEHVSFTFAVDNISRACSHQWVRHRIASYSQQSQRYCGAGEDIGYIVPPSIEKDPNAYEVYAEGLDLLAGVIEDLQTRFDPIAKEDLRFLFPNATPTRMVVTMNARELLHFFKERCCGRAQWEIRAVANEMLLKCIEVLPEVFADAGPKCKIFGGCPEGKRSCGRYKPLEEGS